jgi:esterase/lipase superfamily enzyme
MVEGFSMGGYGAARFGFKHHHLFGTVSILSGGPLQREFTETPRANPQRRLWVLKNIFGGDHEYFRALSPWVLAEQNADAIRSTVRIRLVIGGRDEMLHVIHEFNTHLIRLEIPHAFIVLPGVRHNPTAVLSALGEDNWGFYRDAFSTATQ